MFREVIRSLIAAATTFLICAVAHPALVWGAAHLVFPHRAGGSLILSRDQTVIGSRWIGQKFESPKYFHPRPSAVDYKADASGGSNLGPNNPDLRKAMAARAEENGGAPDRPAPIDLVTASGSGLDPDISREAAEFQVPRIAESRRVDEKTLLGLVSRHVERGGEVVGAPARVNVLMLNLALDEIKPSR